MIKCSLTNEELCDAIAKHDEMVALAGGPPAFTLHTQRMADALRELLAYREESACDLRSLELSLAYESAAGTIDCQCAPERDGSDDVDDWWSNIDDVSDISESVEFVADAVRYLDSRGLLERHPDHSNWVRVLDEDVAEVEVTIAELTPTLCAELVAADLKDGDR